MIYCIAQMFCGRKPWWIWQITGGSPNFTIQILIMSHNINLKKQTSRNLPKFMHQNFLMRNSPKFSFTKHLHYTVYQIYIFCVLHIHTWPYIPNLKKVGSWPANASFLVLKVVIEMTSPQNIVILGTQGLLMMVKFLIKMARLQNIVLFVLIVTWLSSSKIFWSHQHQEALSTQKNNILQWGQHHNQNFFPTRSFVLGSSFFTPEVF